MIPYPFLVCSYTKLKKFERSRGTKSWLVDTLAQAWGFVASDKNLMTVSTSRSDRKRSGEGMGGRAAWRAWLVVSLRKTVGKVPNKKSGSKW